VGSGKRPPWLLALLVAAGAIVVVVVAWFFINKYTRRQRVLADLGTLEFLYERGEVTEEEYREQKAELLAELDRLLSKREPEGEEEHPE
jgi:uncharacterized membrane protein